MCEEKTENKRCISCDYQSSVIELSLNYSIFLGLGGLSLYLYSD